MAQLAQLMISMVGNDVGVECRPLPADDPTQRQPTIDLARDLLEWTPSTELAEGLERTIDYFRRNLRSGQSSLAWELQKSSTGIERMVVGLDVPPSPVPRHA